jgi:4-amino-4-deoxy-L-arabinose transferase-like glycosyltransferase
MGLIRQRLLEAIRHRRFVLGCVLVGVAIRLIWVGFVHPPQVLDYLWYYGRAASIAGGHGYAVNNLPTAYWPPGYTGFLAVIFRLFGTSPFVGQFANVLLSGASIFLGYILCLQLFQSETAARITALLMALHPNQVAYNSLLCSEIWFTFLFLAGAVALMMARGRFRLLALCGICWGLATLTKPQFIFIPAIFLLAVFAWKKDMLKSGVIIYAAVGLCLIPWFVRNHYVMGKAVFSTNGGFDLFQGNNPYSTGTYVWRPEMEAMMGDLQKAADAPLEYDEVRRDKRAWEIGAHYMRIHPWRTIALWPKKWMYLYHSDVDGFFYSMGMMNISSHAMRAAYTGLRVFAELFYILMLALAVLSIGPLLRQARRESLAGFVFVVYFSAITAVFFGLARYHFPLIPWIAMYAAVGAEALLKADLRLGTPTSKALRPGWTASHI